GAGSSIQDSPVRRANRVSTARAVARGEADVVLSVAVLSLPVGLTARGTRQRCARMTLFLA
ncbi:MAG TPA: hypothetical protein VK693_04340, partial [Steroidobacteraceae bacterium]|nr:hypothetical protein [Steroidobacteraceae bacterium]